MSKYALLIRNGTVIDGSGGQRYEADIAITAGKIARIDRPGAIGDAEAERLIDVAGQIVAPGVIDPHTHYDAQIHWDPYCTTSSWHGVTSVAVGNCGFGFAPCAPELRERYMQMMVNTEQVPYEAMRTALPWNWVSYPEWLQRLKNRPLGINIASYLPLNSLMIYVMGIDAAKSRPATVSERARMRQLLHEAMDCGAIGFGFSFLQEKNTHKDYDGSPMPSDVMAVEEAYNLAEVLAERGQGVIQALCELPMIQNRYVAEELARRSRRPVLHNAIAAFDFLPDYHRDILQWLDRCADEGLEIYSQALCFRAWTEFRLLEYNAWDQYPPLREFSLAEGLQGKLRKAADKAWRQRVKDGYSPEAMAIAGGPLETLILHNAGAAAEYEKLEGQLLGEIAHSRNVHVVDLLFDIGIASEMAADFRTTDATSQDATKVLEMMQHPRVLPGTSDGGAHGKFYNGGHFSTDLILLLARETGLMSLEALHHKFSSVPAQALRLENRGELREGWAADIMIYDEQQLDYPRNRYSIAHDLPGGDWRRVVPARGVSRVIVNGEIIYWDNNCQGAVPGQVLSTCRDPQGAGSQVAGA